MVMKKVLAVAVASLMAVPVISMPASAKDGDIIKVGGLNVKLVTDFESCSSNLLCGQNGDESFYSPNNTAENGLNFRVLDGMGVDKSKGVGLGVLDSYVVDDAHPAKNDGVQYDIEHSSNPDNINFEGATDFIVHLDFSNEATDLDQPSINVNFSEWDYNADGTPAMTKSKVTGQENNAITTRNCADDTSTTYYYMADGDTDWTQCTGTSGWVCKFPKNFVGYLRIPMDTFELTWSTKDVNETIDLKHLTRVGFFYGYYPRVVGKPYAVGIDNVGFAGDFSNKETTTNDTPAEETTAAPQGSTKTTVKAASSGTTSNPTTGEAPITAALVTTAVFAGVLVISKKKVRK